jgi:hypothetical protein
MKPIHMMYGTNVRKYGFSYIKKTVGDGPPYTIKILRVGDSNDTKIYRVLYINFKYVSVDARVLYQPI